MSSNDLKFRTEAGYSVGKWPRLYFADTELVIGGYVNTSLEGRYFAQNPPTDGIIVIPNGAARPNFNYYSMLTNYKYVSYGSVSVSNKVCSVTCTTSITDWLKVNDVISLTGIQWDTTHPFVNGIWRVTSVNDATLTFNINVPDTPTFAGNGIVTKGPAFEIFDNRATTDAKGYSFTSVFFVPKRLYEANWNRVLPSDLYTRFRFQSSQDNLPKGGINTNLFNVVDNSSNNIKPVLWAYFFGFNDSTTPNSLFEIAFNSYAIVLRPSGEGSRLEFAIVKFDWGTISDWFNDVIDAGYDRYKSWEVSGTDLGYLIATNPEVSNSGVTEITKSNSFTYDSDIAAKFNLKITIRKHLLSDSILDGTYLVNVLVNDDYDVIGEEFHYSSIMHAYINKPNPINNLTTGQDVRDIMLMPIMYFKFNNIDENNVGVYDSATGNIGSSKIIQDNLAFRQINSSDSTKYLY